MVPVNHKLTAPEVAYILEDSKTALFLFDGSLADVAAKLALPISMAAIDSRLPGLPFFWDQASGPYAPVALKDDDLAQILYTSGTTGNPKGCLHTHAGVMAAGQTGMEAIGLTCDDRMLIAMPIWHSSPLNNWFMGITTAAGTTVLIR